MAERGWSGSDTARAAWGETTNRQGYTVAKNRDRIAVYLLGTTLPGRANLEALAKAFGVEPHDLVPASFATPAEQDSPAFSMTVVAGQPDKTHLRIDQLVPMSVAIQIAQILERAAAEIGSAVTPSGGEDENGAKGGADNTKGGGGPPPRKYSHGGALALAR